jgi:hypothetical protein
VACRLHPLQSSGRPARRAARGVLLVGGTGALSALVPVALAAGGALPIQVAGAAAGAATLTAGVALAWATRRARRESDLRRALGAAGFFLCCLGSVLMLAGVGIYH